VTGTALDLYAALGLSLSVLNQEFARVIAVESSRLLMPICYTFAGEREGDPRHHEQYLEKCGG